MSVFLLQCIVLNLANDNIMILSAEVILIASRPGQVQLEARHHHCKCYSLHARDVLSDSSPP